MNTLLMQESEKGLQKRLRRRCQRGHPVRARAGASV
jgi:hypothetical protein